MADTWRDPFTTGASHENAAYRPPAQAGPDKDRRGTVHWRDGFSADLRVPV